MRRLATALAAVAAVATLSGCILTPSMLPAPPPAQPQPSASSDPGTTSEPGTTSDPGTTTQPAPGESEVAISVAGSTATVTAGGQTWELELLELGPAPEGSIEQASADDPADAPEGFEIGWACFRATLVAAVDGRGAIIDSVASFSVDGGGESFDFRAVPEAIDMYQAYADEGGTIDRVCPLLEVPVGSSYSEITLEAGVIGEDVREEAVVPAP